MNDEEFNVLIARLRAGFQQVNQDVQQFGHVLDELERHQGQQSGFQPAGQMELAIPSAVGSLDLASPTVGGFELTTPTDGDIEMMTPTRPFAGGHESQTAFGETPSPPLFVTQSSPLFVSQGSERNHDAPQSQLSAQVPQAVIEPEVNLPRQNEDLLEIPSRYMTLKIGKLDSGELEKQKPFNYILRTLTTFRRATKPEEAYIALNSLREAIQKLLYTLLNIRIVKSKDGLELLLDIIKTRELPAGMRSDARMLFRNWSRNMFEVDSLRGLEGKRGNKQDLSWPFKVDHAWNVEGHRGLENGQWWPRLICALRDGAHSSPQQGIGSNGLSIVMGCSYEEDMDEGSFIKYSSTILPSDKQGENTVNSTQGERNLVFAFSQKSLVRVIRAKPQTNKIAGRSPYLPKVGYRYDGLYRITKYEAAKTTKGDHVGVFHMVRLPGQDPIRWEGPDMRPNERDEVEMRRVETVSSNNK